MHKIGQICWNVVVASDLAKQLPIFQVEKSLATSFDPLSATPKLHLTPFTAGAFPMNVLVSLTMQDPSPLLRLGVFYAFIVASTIDWVTYHLLLALFWAMGVFLEVSNLSCASHNGYPAGAFQFLVVPADPV